MYKDHWYRSPSVVIFFFHHVRLSSKFLAFQTGRTWYRYTCSTSFVGDFSVFLSIEWGHLLLSHPFMPGRVNVSAAAFELCFWWWWWWWEIYISFIWDRIGNSYNHEAAGYATCLLYRKCHLNKVIHINALSHTFSLSLKSFLFF